MIYYEIYTLEKRLGPPLYAISYTVYINSTVSSNIKKKLQYTPTSTGGDRIYPWL